MSASACNVLTECPVSPTAPPAVRIAHSGQGCNVEEERYSERVFTIREGGTLELQCLVTGHPRPQVAAHLEHWFHLHWEHWLDWFKQEHTH